MEVADEGDIKLLVQSGDVDWNKSDDNEDLAIMWALKNNKYGIVEELLAAPDVKLDIRDKEGWSLVFRAISTLKKGKCIFIINRVHLRNFLLLTVTMFFFPSYVYRKLQ